MLKFFEAEGRFPEYAAEVPERAVAYLAEQVRVDAALFAKYDFSSRSAKYHRTQIREELGFRECSEFDQAQLAEWLSREQCPTQLGREQLRDAVITRCRAERLEPPTFGQLARLVSSAVRMFEERFCRVTEERLDGAVGGVAARLEELIGLGAEDAAAVAGGGERFLYETGLGSTSGLDEGHLRGVLRCRGGAHPSCSCLR